MILIVLLYTLMAASFTIAKAVVDYAAPLFFVGVRMIAAGVGMIGYLWLARRSGWKTIKQTDVWYFVLAMFVHVYLTYALDLLSIAHMSSSKAAFIYNLSPFLTALYSYIHFSERMTTKKWAGLLIGFAGFIPEFMASSSMQESQYMAFGAISWPELMMVGSVIFAAYGWIVVRMLLERGYSAPQINGVAMLGGGALSLVTSLWYEQWWSASPVYAWGPFIGLTVLIILVSNVGAYNLYGHLLKQYTATFVSFAGFLCPLIAAILGLLFLREPLSLHFFFSLFVVSVGLYLFYAEELRQGYVAN